MLGSRRSADEQTGVVTPARRASPRRAGLPMALTIPALLLIALVSLVPTVYAFRLSLYHTQFFKLTDFAGLENYKAAIGTSAAWADMIRTLVYVSASLLITLPLGLGLALLLNRPVRFRGLFRTVIFLPWVMSQTVAALLWKWLLNPSYGPLHLGSLDVFAYPESAMGSLILINVWLSYPLAAMLMLAALQNVSAEMLEAAEVDGAGPVRRVVSVILPTISPTLLIVAITLSLLYFNMVTLVYTLTGGGPYSGTQVVSLQAFRESFQFFHLGLGAAYSIVLFGCNIIFGAAYVRVLRTES